MPRVKTGSKRRQKRKKILKLAKGYRGGRKNLRRTAMDAIDKALNYAYAHRRTRKRQFRRLWIARINAAARIHGMSYSQLIYGLNQAGVELNRKVLADLAVNDETAFAEIVSIAKD
ncbi:50S ribosomal protein L20 [Candidatus Poribacteria bacterium]|jgi:large subunit ribosomal protein L20|nr:50S ribosomal protein L20 [Candidatus Poribacteria bacterium]MCH2574034.1 50S ribosomal protein L20 [Candidatus Poribacteria bacterium]|tara:strand:- start:801 stop:1148 length:348 start_codon:yes stop_codon:yes gene_type:complete